MSIIQSLITKRDATNARILAMQQLNAYRLTKNDPLAYLPEHFNILAVELETIATQMEQCCGVTTT